MKNSLPESRFTTEFKACNYVETFTKRNRVEIVSALEVVEDELGPKEHSFQKELHEAINNLPANTKVMKVIEYDRDRQEELAESFFDEKFWIKQKYISVSKDYKALVTYTKFKIKRTTYIFVKDFASPEDIITEMFLKISDFKADIYETYFVVKTINKTIQEMWKNYCLNTPRLRAAFIRRTTVAYRLNREHQTKNLTNNYIKKLISGATGLRYKDITNSMVEKKREYLKSIRDMGVTPHGKGRGWKTDEDELLRFEYSNNTAEQLSVILKRTKKSVEKRIEFLKLKKPSG